MRLKQRTWRTPHFRTWNKNQQTKKRDSLKDMDFILDIPLEVSVELGRTKC